MSDAAVSLPDSLWADAVALLRTASDATLVCHVAPDGDALGSMLALAHVLRRRGVDVTCTWGDERWSVPASYRWLPGIDTVSRPADVAQTSPSLLIVLDTGSRDRLGVLQPLADRAGAIVVLDHHAHNAGLGGLHLVDSRAAATAVVVEELIRRLGEELDETTATCLYTGLVTDTGSFQHSVTTPAVHAVAGRLLAAGTRPDEVGRRLWGTRPFGFVQVLGAALSRATLEVEAAGGRGLVWTWTTSGDLDAAGIGIDEIEPIIEVVRQSEEADVAAVFKGDVDGTFRVSTRSRGLTDVGSACAALGGGGHRLAAGFTSRDDVETTIAKLRLALDDAPAPA
ncbi:MAG TPA: bifunctional oligoribonuclease/PAP phosphatase NrnA [Mycobacteriales bacterium]|jgi:phosphoesterase RecJ-like protein|nr:bifunctional oligoribonuclease/PAP phosphatase NrnA [Mycobacteriales bacterium]